MHKARWPVAIFANGIGDHLINLPAARALAALYPDGLTIICRQGVGQLFFSDLPLRVPLRKVCSGLSG